MEHPRRLWQIRQNSSLWVASNPGVKFSVLVVLSYGVLAGDLGLTVKLACLILAMLFVKFKGRLTDVVLGILLVVAIFLVGKIPYSEIPTELHIPHVAKLSLPVTLSAIVAFPVFLLSGRRMGTADYSWVIELFPRSWRPGVAQYVHSAAFSRLGMPWAMEETSKTIYARGGAPVLSLRQRHVSGFIDRIGLWIHVLDKQLDEMRLSVEHTVLTRIGMDYRSEPFHHSTSADITIAGVAIVLLLEHWWK